MSQAQWHKPVIPALRRLRQEDCELEATLGYIETLSQKETREDE
jgi:hypothetical protein